MIRPLDNRIVVKPFPVENLRSSGILLIENEKEKPLSGEVIAIGPGRKNEDGTHNPMQIKVGDRIMYGKYAPRPFKHQGVDLLTMCEMDVLFVLED